MLKWFLTRAIAATRKNLGVDDFDYAYRLRDVAPWRLLRFSFIKTVEGPRKLTPPEVYHAAGLAAAMVEDCGPCVQIHVNLALKDGVTESVLQALLKRDFSAAGADAALGFRFGDAVARGEDASDYRDAITARWDEPGVIELAFTIATARFYPAVKRGMGYARACEKIKVGAVETYPAKAA
jgi:AhpD family alkylhydroperoxidase